MQRPTLSSNSQPFEPNMVWLRASSEPERPTIDPELSAHLKRNGYRDLRMLRDERIIGLSDTSQTTDLFVGLTRTGYAYRYCYRRAQDPKKDLAQYVVKTWDGTGHPPGPWIKRQGLDPEIIGPGAEK